ncbi:hypothetical protein C5E51_24965 [Nocardia nova]|uniref:Uncharacterized protein n=1 Tax=Nocardia nova TaxID=37330 RepID=A0A2T2YXN5_9NOCA|nr:hypothetical protein A5748_22325 [Nocardia sp. 852002-51244_SCH5132740]PPI89630.1 hypothetical protein C5E46_32735 [Nocardia nova]PPJ04707.1 hypothetical protein C5E51_24965 [Nocardia nova]PSR60264.1 hypothetical protein C8259_24630 [Nocardia nova]
MTSWAMRASITCAASSTRAMAPTGPESPGGGTAILTASAAPATAPSRAPTSPKTAANSSTEAAKLCALAAAASAAGPCHPA